MAKESGTYTGPSPAYKGHIGQRPPVRDGWTCLQAASPNNWETAERVARALGAEVDGGPGALPWRYVRDAIVGWPTI
jgi:hypothetical protein